METQKPSTNAPSRFLALLLGVSMFGISLTVASDPIQPSLQTQIDLYTTTLSNWATDPVVIDAVREANQTAPTALDNKTWSALPETDPTVATYLNNDAAKKVRTWQEKEIRLGKLYLRNKNGDLVAASGKPRLFNISDKPTFTQAITGKPWQQEDVKPDPTTNTPSVQISVPIRDGNEVIGIMQAAVVDGSK